MARIPGFHFQVSELVKFLVILYTAGYIARHERSLKEDWRGFVKPMAIITFLAVLLLRQPDFGAAVVIFATTLGMMFLSGVRLRYFLLIFSVSLLGLAFLARLVAVRMQRVVGFLHPWENPFDSGYQLTQALIAFGRGGVSRRRSWGRRSKAFLFARGSHRFSVCGHCGEFGLVGALMVLALFALFVFRIFVIARRALLDDRLFEAHACYGIGLWLALQAMINLGVNTGLLPTKGLTLPFVSYGGSSLLVNVLALAFVLRVDHETRLASFHIQAKSRHRP